MIEKDLTIKGIVFCDPPIKTERFEFLFNHLDCDCIADTSEESITDRISVLAYSTDKNANASLRKYFYEKGYGKKYRYLIGIDRRELNSIDNIQP